jgi:flagellar basal-body rod protein FlgG
MYEAVFIAATGLRHQQMRMDTIANNIANVNSAAYKSARLDFKDALYTAEFNPSYPRTPEPEGNQQKGHGVMIAGITKDFRTGSIQHTGRDLDIAIEGEGFFELEDPNGNIVYSRNGSFEIGVGENGLFLVNGDGWYIHDAGGNRIQIPDETETIVITEHAIIKFKLPPAVIEEDEDTAAAEAAAEEAQEPEEEWVEVELGLFTFRNITGLLSVGSGNYGESEASGEKFKATNAKLWQGNLEMGNVDLAEEMTRIIRTQRVFQLASRALSTADEMEGIANNMRR